MGTELRLLYDVGDTVDVTDKGGGVLRGEVVAVRGQRVRVVVVGDRGTVVRGWFEAGQVRQMTVAAAIEGNAL